MALQVADNFFKGMIDGVIWGQAIGITISLAICVLLPSLAGSGIAKARGMYTRRYGM